MTIEVHSFGREISAGRTITAALFLLVISCALAAAMSWKRAGNPLVSIPIPPDWNVRFQIPRMFETGEPIQTRRSTVLPFLGKTANDVHVICVLWKGDTSEAVDIDTTAQNVMAEVGVGANLFGEVRTRPATTAPMGDHEGLELMSVSETAVVRVVNIGKEVYAVLYAVRRSKLAPDIYHLFDLTCRSMNVARN